MTDCCQNLMLNALSSSRALSVMVGGLFKEFSLLLNMPRIFMYVCMCVCMCVWVYVRVYVCV